MGSILSVPSSKPESTTTDKHDNHPNIKGDGNISGSNYNINITGKNSLVVIAIACVASFGIYVYFTKIHQTELSGTPALPSSPASAVGTLNVGGNVGRITSTSNFKL